MKTMNITADKARLNDVIVNHFNETFTIKEMWTDGEYIYMRGIFKSARAMVSSIRCYEPTDEMEIQQ